MNGNPSEVKGGRKGKDRAGRGCWKNVGAAPLLSIFKPGIAEEASGALIHSIKRTCQPFGSPA
jgi:hypothetical protein